MRTRALAWVTGGGILLWVLVVRGSLAPARTWEATVAASLEAVPAEAERRAAPR